MGGFDEKKKEEAPEAPTAELYKNMATEWPDKLLGHAGMFNAESPFEMMDDHSFDWTQRAGNEALAEMHEANETVASPITNALGAASSLADATAPGPLWTEKRGKAAVSSASGIASLAGGAAADVGGAGAFGLMMYDAAKTGSEDLKNLGMLGKNDDGTNRDASQAAADAGGAFGASIHIGPHGMVTEAPDTDSLLDDAVTAIGIEGASLGTGLLAAGVGTGHALAEGATALDPMKMAQQGLEAKKKEQAADAEYEEKMKHASPDQAKVLLAQHLFGTGE